MRNVFSATVPIPPLLEVKNLRKSFDQFEVIHNLHLSAKKGEFICIVGPSGCGKTVFLYHVAGFLKPTAGEILINGKPVESPDTSRMMLFQNYVLFPWKTVYENVIFALEKSEMAQEKKHDLVMRHLDLVGLTSFKDFYPNQLSGGMQQRAALARALVVNPSVLLMDEPFSAIDSQYRKFLREGLVDIWKKTQNTVIFVTHSIHEAIYLADRIYVLSKRPSIVKKVITVDLPRPRNPQSKGFIKVSNEIERHLSNDFNEMMQDKLSADAIQFLLSREAVGK